MNRRSFLTRIAKAVAVTVAAPTILPAATTYVRQWRKQGAVIVPFWYQTTKMSTWTDENYEAWCQKQFVESFFFNKPFLFGDPIPAPEPIIVQPFALFPP